MLELQCEHGTFSQAQWCGRAFLGQVCLFCFVGCGASSWPVAPEQTILSVSTVSSPAARLVGCIATAVTGGLGRRAVPPLRK